MFWGWVYVAFVLDVYLRMTVRWQVSYDFIRILRLTLCV